MKIDALGLPQENGASDLQDSARLAGIMATFNYPAIIFLSKYFDGFKYVRHPSEYRYTFSRDQTLCYIAGLKTQSLEKIVDLKYVNGIDIFTPAHRGHVARCQGKKTNWFQDLWFWFDVWRAAKFDKLGEPNQILCQMMIADKKFLKFWLKENYMWREAIEEYWCKGQGAWRGEPELAAHMIKVLEGYEG